MTFLLIIHSGFKQDMDRLFQAWKGDPNSPGGREFQASVDALRALRDGREDAYEGKQLGYGPQSYDLRDCAELKVPVDREFTSGGHERGPSHRLVYREFEPLDRVVDGHVVRDPGAQPYRQAVAFAHRSQDPAAIAGERLGRERGMPHRDLYGLTGGGRPDIGPRQEGVQTTPHRIPVPGDLMRQAAILRDSPPAGSRPAPSATPEARVNRPEGQGPGQSKER